jgi:hypothetical protein
MRGLLVLVPSVAAITSIGNNPFSSATPAATGNSESHNSLINPHEEHFEQVAPPSSLAAPAEADVQSTAVTISEIVVNALKRRRTLWQISVDALDPGYWLDSLCSELSPFQHIVVDWTHPEQRDAALQLYGVAHSAVDLFDNIPEIRQYFRSHPLSKQTLFVPDDNVPVELLTVLAQPMILFIVDDFFGFHVNIFGTMKSPARDMENMQSLKEVLTSMLAQTSTSNNIHATLVLQNILGCLKDIGTEFDFKLGPGELHPHELCVQEQYTRVKTLLNI